MAVLTVTETVAGPSRLNDDESGPSAGNGATSPMQKVLNHRPAWKELVDGHLLNTTYCNVHIHGIDGHVPCHHIFLKNMSSMLDELIQDRVTSGSAPTPTNVLSIHLQETKVEHIQVVLSVLNSGQAVIDLKDEEEVRQVLRMLNIEKIVFEKQPVDEAAYVKMVRRENVIKTRGGGGEGDSEEELGDDDDIDDEVDVEDLEESLCGICALSFNSEMQLEAHLKEGCARAQGFGKYFHLQKRFCKGCATNFENYDAATFIKHVDACVKSNYRGNQGREEEDVDMEQDNLESDSNSVDICPLRLFNVELDQLSSQVVKQIQQVIQKGKPVRLTRFQRRHYVFVEGESSTIASNEPKPNGCQRKEGEGKRRKLGPKSRRQRDLSQAKSMPIPTAEIPTPPVTAVTENAQPTAMDISPPVPEVNAVAQPTAMDISPPVPAINKVAHPTFSDISTADEEIQSSSQKQVNGRRKKPGSKSRQGETITAKATETPPVVTILPPPPAAEASTSPPAAVNTTPALIVQEIQRPTVIQEAPLSNLEMEAAAGKEATIIAQTQFQTEQTEKRTKSGPKRKTCPPPTLPHLHAIPTTASPLPMNMTITATTQPLSETITPPPPLQATIPLLVASTIPPALAVTLPSFASVPIPPHLATSVSPSPPLSSTIAQIFSPMEIQPLDVQPNDIEIPTPTTSKIVVRSQAAQTLGSLISSSTSTFSRETEFSSSATDLYCAEMIETDLARNMIPTGRNENNSSAINEAISRISDTVIFEPISPPEMLVVDVSPDSLAYGCPCAQYPCACDVRWPIPSSSSTTFSRVNSATLGRNAQGVPPASSATGASPFQFIPTMTYSPRVSNNRTPPTNTTTHTTTVGPVMFPHLPTPTNQRYSRPSRPGFSVFMSGRGTVPFLPFARRSPTSQRSFRSVPPPRLIPAPIARRPSSIDMRQARPRTPSPSFGFLPQQLGNGIVVSRVTVPQPPPPSRSLATNQGNNNVINPSLIRDPRLEQNRVVLPPTAAAFRSSTPTQARTLRPRQAGIRTLRNEHPPTFRFEPRIFRPQTQQQFGSPRTPPPTLRLPVFRPRIEVGQIYNRANGRLLQSPRQTPPPPSQAGMMERIARTHAQSPPQLRRAIPEPIITTAPTPNYPVQMNSSDPWDIINVTPPPQNQQQQQRPQDLQIPSPSPLLQYQSPSSPPDIMSIVCSPEEPPHLLSPLGFRNETFSMNLETGTRYEEPVVERRIPRVIYTCPDCRLSFETREGYQSHHEDGLC
ncbi:unnamed protein product [Orchesella dallaii]|uniref:Uncharacterized protein n=1 Tax=Orchesella dallaii TaxID=48710 RepID=A0ABP1REL1_9HEXA